MEKFGEKFRELHATVAQNRGGLIAWGEANSGMSQ